jgi:CheY-like chemotaxis protein
MSLLIVEDDAGVRDSLSNLLRDEGYEVVTANGGHDALRRLETGPLPSLILLDLMMPEMDGREFRARQLADPRIAGIPVVVVSARPDVRQAARYLGAAGFLAKPMSFQALLWTVQNTAITVVTTLAIRERPRNLREAWRALHPPPGADLCTARTK